MPQIVWTAKPDGNLDYYNQRWFDYTGMTLEQTRDWGWQPVLHPDDLLNCVDRWTKAFTTGSDYQVEYRFKRAADGAYRWHLGRAFPMKNQRGEIIHWVGTCTDIEDQKCAEESLREARAGLEQRVRERTNELVIAKERAESANAIKSEFLANMSHELRTPLNGVIGLSSFLATQKPGPLNPKQQEYLTDILNSGRHLLLLVNDVLDLSKVEAGKMELFPEEFSAQHAVQDVCAILAPEAKRKQIAVVTAISLPCDRLILDQQKFKQVLFNLLSNAVKFTEHAGRIQVSADHDGRSLSLRVQDSGIGIKAEDFGKLFVEFQQLDSGAARHYQGTGLGLALSRKIVEFQGGAITVESEHGKGSLFTVLLPCQVKDSTPIA